MVCASYCLVSLEYKHEWMHIHMIDFQEMNEKYKGKTFCFIVCNYLCSLCVWLSMRLQFCKIQLDLSCSLLQHLMLEGGRGACAIILCALYFSSASKGRASIESCGWALLLIWWAISDLFIFIHFWHFTGFWRQSHIVIYLGHFPKTMFFKCVHYTRT